MNKALEHIRSFFRINDSPQRVALGLSVGVFTGILPGAGPIAALFLALVLRVNRASALAGSLLTNTWLSVVTFLLAVKTGSWFFGLDWQDVRNSYLEILKDFHWAGLFRSSFLEILLPVLLGYLVVSFCLASVLYLLALILLKSKNFLWKNRLKQL